MIFVAYKCYHSLQCLQFRKEIRPHSSANRKPFIIDWPDFPDKDERWIGWNNSHEFATMTSLISKLILQKSISNAQPWYWRNKSAKINIRKFRNLYPWIYVNILIRRMVRILVNYHSTVNKEIARFLKIIHDSI